MLYFTLAIAVLSTVFLVLYLRHRKKCQFWAEQGVPQPDGVPSIFGNNPATAWKTMSGQINVNTLYKEFYEENKMRKFIGTYALMGQPVLVVNDLDLVKNILVKDFSHFINRNGIQLFIGTSKADEIWRNMLSLARDERWKTARTVFTPIFTSGKIKFMTQFINEISRRLVVEVDKVHRERRAVDLKEICGKFSMDGIAACAFGMDLGTFSTDESPFVANARALFQNSSYDILMFLLLQVPGVAALMRLLKVPIMKPRPTMFFYKVVTDALRERRRTGLKRNDMIDLMIGAVESERGPSQRGEVDDLMVIGTAVVFLVAGYDTTANTLSFLLWELALHPDVQRRARREVDAACGEAGRRMPEYAAIQGMDYLDMVVSETLRRWSPVGGLTRGVNAEYAVPATDVRLPEKSEVHVPVVGIMYDGRYYERPGEFYPEHFTKEAKAGRHPYAYLPFGQGPRNCIGMRFALLEIKMAVIAILSRYEVVECPETPRKITLAPGTFLGNSLDPLIVKFEERGQPSIV